MKGKGRTGKEVSGGGGGCEKIEEEWVGKEGVGNGEETILTERWTLDEMG